MSVIKDMFIFTKRFSKQDKPKQDKQVQDKPEQEKSDQDQPKQDK